MDFSHLPQFIEARKQNWGTLRQGIAEHEDVFEFSMPSHASGYSTELNYDLYWNQIGNRMLFGGNLLRQPAFAQLRKDNPAALRVVGEMEGSDEIMNTALFLGTYPGLTDLMIKNVIKVIHHFVKKQK